MNCIKKLNEKIEGIGKRWELVLVILLSALMVLGIIIGMGKIGRASCREGVYVLV